VLKNAPPLAEQSQIQKESLENRANSEAAQRERYYATIHKVSMQNNDKIPGEWLIGVGVPRNLNWKSTCKRPSMEYE